MWGVRRFAVAAATLAAACAVVSAPNAHATPALDVRGPAGSSFWVTVSPGTQFNSGGTDVTATSAPGGWASIAIVRVSKDEVHHPSDVYAATYLPESVRCPGASCRYEVPPPAMTSDINGKLPSGRYRLVLLGPAGSVVDVTVHPMHGRVLSPQRAGSVLMKSELATGAGPASHETALHAYAALPPGQGWGLVLGLPTYAIAPAGAVGEDGCVTVGPSDTVATTIGGVAPCADFQGFDVFTGASAYPATSVVGAPTASWAGEAAVWGPRDGDSLGVGWDMTVAAPSSYLRFAVVGFALPA